MQSMLSRLRNFTKSKASDWETYLAFLFYKESIHQVAPLDKKSLTNRTYMSAYSIVYINIVPCCIIKIPLCLSSNTYIEIHVQLFSS